MKIPNPNTPEWRKLIEQIITKGSEMAYTIRDVDGKGYLIESQSAGGLVFISFTSSLNLTTEQEARLVNDFKDLLIKRLNLEPQNSQEPQVGTEATCKMCGEPIRYVGPYWEHLGELQPRHPAWPKETV